MSDFDPARLFAVIRQIAGRGLTQGEVDAVNAVLAGEEPAQVDTFDRALAVILKHEGGFADHPADPGGVTMLGVTKATWESWIGGKTTREGMRNLTVAHVSPLYRERYWNVVGGDELPAPLALCVFDFAVNAGPSRAVRYLQNMVNVYADGVMGPKTMAAAQQFVAAAGVAEAVRHYQTQRRGYYRQLKTFPTFGRGWLRRVDEVESEALRWI